jgi:hypothetical protein
LAEDRYRLGRGVRIGYDPHDAEQGKQ